MKLSCLLLFFITTFHTVAWAQRNGSLKGFALDTLAKQPVAGATITLMQKKDSSLVSFTMTDNNGRFELRGIANGDYRLLITHVNYHNRHKYFTISNNLRDIDLGNISMYDIKKELPEVVVSGEAPPVTMINDTIQYNAGSFKVQPNANVEALLKKLPGVKVEKDGTVKAQGEKVNKVLVDGKEFFGNDPKIATRNLPADAVDKVQVYDRRSEQAQLTGFDDGNSEKTINLKLKKDKKKGLFGKASAGYGTSDRYEGKFNVNSFKGARQLSVIGMGNNSNAEGFSFLDMLNFTGELNRLKQGGSGGNISITINSDDPNAALLGGNPNSGINTTWAGGINYNNIIGKKTDLQSNYFYSRFNPNTDRSIQRQYFLPDSTSYFYNENSFTDNLRNSQRLNLNADILIDSFHSLRITPSFGYQDTKNSSFTEYSNIGEDQFKKSEGFSRNYVHNQGLNFRNDLLFRKKFHRKGRTFSILLQNSFNQSEGDGSLQSINRFYDPFTRFDSINQHSSTQANLLGYNTRLVYTEPVFKKSLLEFSLGKSDTRSGSQKTTQDYDDVSGKYDQPNPLLTNNFENVYAFTQAGLRLRTQKKKYNYSFGVSRQQADLRGTIKADNKDSVIRKTFYNWLPNARFQYNFTRYRSLVLNYAGNTNQPTMSQLQPVPDNSNPFNISEGNPDLKQEYTHIMRVQFNSINPFKNKNLFIFMTLSKTNNRIVNYDLVGPSGVRVTKPVNVDGVYNLNGDVSVGLPVRFLKATFNIGSEIGYNRNKQEIGYNRNKQFINATGNTINSMNLGPDFRLDLNLSEKAIISLNMGINYTHTQYSLQSALNKSYFSQRYGTEFEWTLPENFFFAADFTYSIQNQVSAGFNKNVALWNASISKQFLHFNRGELKLKAFDLLDQNIGISRNTNQNYVEDVRVKTLKRFFLLSFIYSLNKNGLAQGGAGAVKMITR